jgi:hypothetical protein
MKSEKHRLTGSLRVPSAGERGTAASILYFLLWFYILYQVVYWWIYRPWGHVGSDFYKHWYASRALLDGLTIYQGDYLEMEFNHPHALAYIFFWLSYFKLATAEKIWECMNICFITVCWLLAWKKLRPDPGNSGPALILYDKWPLFCAVSVLSYSPLVTNVWVGNIDALNCLLMLGLVVCLLKNHQGLAGILWACMVLSKILPILLLVPFLTGGNRKLVLSGMAFLSGYLIALLLAGKLEDDWFYITGVLPEISWYWRGISTSVGRLVLEMTDRWHMIEDPAVYNRINAIWSVILGLFYIVMACLSRIKRVDFMRLLELSLIFLPLFSPLLEWHHFVWTFPAWFLQVNRWLAGRMSRLFQIVHLVGWLVLAFSFQINDLLSSDYLFVVFSHLIAGLFLALVNTLEFICHDVRGGSHRSVNSTVPA